MQEKKLLQGVEKLQKSCRGGSFDRRDRNEHREESLTANRAKYAKGEGNLSGEWMSKEWGE